MKTIVTLIITSALTGNVFAQALEVTPTGVAYGNSGTRTEWKDNAGQMGGRSGFYETYTPSPASSWYPGAVDWQHLIEARHSNTGNNFALQIAGSFWDQNLWFRKTANNPNQPWSKILTQNTSGYVGINDSSPVANLQINQINDAGWSGNLRAFRILSPDNRYNLDLNTYVIAEGNVGYHFSPNGNTGMVLTTPGNVGIGTTTPFGKLTVSSGNGDALNVYNPGDNAIALQTTLDGQPLNGYGGDGHNRLLLQPITGNVGIGTTSPAFKLDVAGDIRIGTSIYSAQRPNFYLAMQGDRNVVLYDNGGPIWKTNTYASDIRIKENIFPLAPVLDSLEKIRVVEFNYKPGVADDKRHIGVIAQELEAVYPDFVYSDPQSGRKLVQYDMLSTLAIQGLKELDAEHKAAIDDLRAEIAALRAEIQQLKNRP
jgi:hypothetical protein